MIVSHFAFLTYVFLFFVDQSFCFLRLTSWDEIDLGNMMFRICWLLELSSPVGVLSWLKPW